MFKKLKELYDYREMIISLVRKDLRGRYKSSVLGFLWTFINPLCQIIVYTLVFSQIFRMGIEKYYLHLTALPSEPASHYDAFIYRVLKSPLLPPSYLIILGCHLWSFS